MEKSRINKGINRLSLSLYLNYIAHEFALLIVAQNMTTLSAAWHQPLAVVFYIISGVGVGRLIAYPITGYFSDKLSRKLFVYLGMLCYFTFAVGIPFSNKIAIAYSLAILAGVANSALDTRTYTTFVEMGGGNGKYNVLLKAVVSIGEFILPLLVTLFRDLHLWFGWSFMIMAGILVINAILLFRKNFLNALKLLRLKINLLAKNHQEPTATHSHLLPAYSTATLPWH